MRILHLTPGTGNFHCGGTLRDHTLVCALRERGHEVLLAPLYLPPVLDKPEPSRTPVFLGGVGLYGRQRSSLISRFPEWMLRPFNATPILRTAAGFAEFTRAKDLGEMTLGAFENVDGPQRKSWEVLLKWIEARMPLDLISISPGLLAGFARTLRKRFGVPVVVSLQGEDAFLDSLEEPWKSRAWESLQASQSDVRCFVCPSEDYARRMRERLALPEDKCRVIYPGLEESWFSGRDAAPEVPTIGFLARQIHGKGLGLLVDAFIRLKESSDVPDLRLKVGGSATWTDRPFIRKLKRRLRKSGLSVQFLPNLSLKEKQEFLATVSVLSVPALYEEAFGLYTAEALASGVPIVQPAHGAFPETVTLAEGGRLFSPGDPAALASALKQQLQQPWEGEALRERARRLFSADRMAREFEQLAG